MRRAVLLGVATAVVAAVGAFAVAAPAPPVVPVEPHITRLFIPAIKAACLDRVGLPVDADLGYTFGEAGNLVTIDHDGHLTGLSAYALYVLNSCLARYPIEPTVEVPQDRYTRNLFYDYLDDLLELATACPALPPYLTTA